jgi:hypothetical protein
MAPNTWKAYRAGVASFEHFLSVMSFPVRYPAVVEQLLQYVAYLSCSEYSPGTVKTYLSGIGHHHKLLGTTDPTQSFLLRKVVEGMSRTGKRKDVRAPITYTVLQQLVAALPLVCFSIFESDLFRAAFLVTYFAMLRVSEVASEGADTSRALQCSDISFSPDYRDMYVVIRYSKTDQRGNSTTLHVQAMDNSGMCPVHAMRIYMQARQVSTGPLFRHFNGSPLTKYQFGALLQKSLCCAGINNGVFRSHSLRIGACTTAIRNGLDEATVKAMGRWKSNAYMSYIR